MTRRSNAIIAVFSLGGILGLGVTGIAAEISFTTDGKYQLVNKVNGTERWMLARELATGRIVVNVFNPSEPQNVFFFDCGQTGSTSTDYLFSCGLSLNGGPWSGDGLDNVPVAKVFFGEGGPPSRPSGCTVYTDSCPGALPEYFAAAGGEITFDGIGTRSSTGSLSVIQDEFSPDAMFQLLTDSVLDSPSIVMGFVGTEEFLDGDASKLVLESREGTGGGTCINASGFPEQIIRSAHQRVEFCAVCGLGGPVVGRFNGEFQLLSGSSCTVGGEFRMFRTD